MGHLIGDVVRVALGIRVEFHMVAWIYVTVLALVLGPVFAQVGPRWIDPPATLLATKPQKVAMWMPLSLLLTFAVIFAFAISIVGAPAAFLVPIAGLMATFIGYIALARLLGARIVSRVAGSEPAPYLAALVGIVVFRLVRLVPIVGAFAHSMLCWVSYAAVIAIFWSIAINWHRRRMPESKQFRGETLVEWYPDGDPIDGKPAFGTGRPVVGNIRGEEDRAPRRDDPANG